MRLVWRFQLRNLLVGKCDRQRSYRVVKMVRRFPLVMLLGAIQGVLGVVAGLYLSFYLNIASGATIVLVLVVAPLRSGLRRKKGSVA